MIRLVQNSRNGMAGLSGWSFLQTALCLLLLAPAISIIVVALMPSPPIIGHLIETVLGRYLWNTLLLMSIVGILAVLFGVSTAWIVSRYQFVGCNVLSWLLVLPAAIPAYIIAYAYTDFLEYAGPVQSLVRAIFGFESARDYVFFEVRSLGSAAVMMASVLYPYIYIMARTAFRHTSGTLFEVAMVSGKNLFWHVALPLARPAIIAGLSLVCMEVVSDFGTVEFFAIDTLTLGIFNVWLGMNNMPAAAQLSLIALIVMIALLAAELFARSRRSFQNLSNAKRGVPQIKISGRKMIVLYLICGLPLVIGFILPVLILASFLIDGIGVQASARFFELLVNNLLVSAMAAFGIIIAGLLIGIITHYKLGRIGHILALAAASGYAIPGTILAIGVLGFMGGLNKLMMMVGGPLLSGGLIALMIAYMVRFHAVGYGAVSSGLGRMPNQLFEASQALGKNFSQSLALVVLPILSTSIGAGCLLVFVDVMKELPMTLLLRPFNFETFATFTYQFAKEEMIEEAALPALMIVMTGLIPVILLNYSVTRPQR
ncbi:MAG: ABC transporter permease [Candidatus Puniceispirillaceae bacterium]